MPGSLAYLPYTVLLLGILIFVHEMGHFLVAKALGVKVLRFSIGFGPPIAHFTRGETEYRIAWFPLGGYVKMAGEQPYDELPPEEAKRGFLAQAPWKRMLIVAAGPVFNLIFPVLVFFVTFLGVTEVPSNLVGSVEPGMPAAEAGIRAGDRIVAIEGESVQVFEDLVQRISARPDRPTVVTIDRGGKQLTLTLTPERNTERDPLETITRGQIGIRPYAHPPLLGVPAGSPAAAAGLKTFDRVLSVNGQPIKDEGALERVLSGASGELEVQVLRREALHVPGVGGTNPTVVQVRVPRQPGDGYQALGAEASGVYVGEVAPDSPAAKAGLQPLDRIEQLNGAPVLSFLSFANTLSERIKDQPFELSWRSASGEEHSAQLRQARSKEKNALGNESGHLDLGLRPWDVGRDEAPTSAEMVQVRMGPGKAFVRAVQIVPMVTAKIATVIGYMITGKVSMEMVGGPIMLHQMASRAAEQGFDNFLRMMALISINLGLVNLLPIPILDGFHFLAAAWEAIRRRPISMRAREIANWVGLVMLVSLIARVFYNDLFRR